MRQDSWKCVCGWTVHHDDEGTVVELDGVVHTCDVEDEDDY